METAVRTLRLEFTKASNGIHPPTTFCKIHDNLAFPFALTTLYIQSLPLFNKNWNPNSDRHTQAQQTRQRY
jgi:hypothetical protein